MAFTDGNADDIEDPALSWFVTEVNTLAKGKLYINVVFDCCGEAATDEESLVKDVASSKFALGWVPTRALAKYGVTSVQALNAPLLINSYGVEQSVFNSSIPTEMLSGFKPAGVVGLAIEPGFLREPISQHFPLLSASDWKNVPFQTVPSAEDAQSISDLGARPLQVSGSVRDDGLGNGQIQGFDNSIEFEANNQNLTEAVLASNVNLWPRVDAFIANPAVLAELTPQQRGWLATAAADTAKRAKDLQALDDQYLPTYCANAGEVATATPADLESLTAAVAPEYALLDKNPATKKYITEIEALKKTAPADAPLVVPAGCEYAAQP
jgi:TRAP-type C4-dicarboxylate transport system substrate-binding protein